MMIKWERVLMVRQARNNIGLLIEDKKSGYTATNTQIVWKQPIYGDLTKRLFLFAVRWHCQHEERVILNSACVWYTTKIFIYFESSKPKQDETEKMRKQMEIKHLHVILVQHNYIRIWGFCFTILSTCKEMLRENRWMANQPILTLSSSQPHLAKYGNYFLFLSPRCLYCGISWALPYHGST